MLNILYAKKRGKAENSLPLSSPNLKWRFFIVDPELAPVRAGNVIGLDVRFSQITADAIVADQDGQAS
jgi:hypothetical protein